jgi:hypothetical protein
MIVVLAYASLMVGASALAEPNVPLPGQVPSAPAQEVPATQDAERGEFPPPLPAELPEDARVLYARDGWVVWLARRIDPNDRRRNPGAVHWFWRQRIGGQPTYVGSVRSSLRQYDVPLVLGDGTILLVRDRRSYVWVEPGAGFEPDEGDWAHWVTIEQRCHIHAGWPDGLVVVPARHNESPPVYFVPLRGREPVVEARVVIVPEGDLRLDYYLKVRRAGDEIAVANSILNVRTGRRREVPLEFTHPSNRGLEVVAFDGELLLCSNRHELVVHDLKTGQTRGVNEQHRASLRLTVAVHNRVAYCAFGSSRQKPLSVMAYDLAFPDDADEAPPTHVSKVKVFETAARPCAVVPMPDGLHVWTGGRWQRLDWVKPPQAGPGAN